MRPLIVVYGNNGRLDLIGDRLFVDVMHQREGLRIENWIVVIDANSVEAPLQSLARRVSTMVTRRALNPQN